MIRPLGAAALAILTLSACAPIDPVNERFFPPEETAVPRVPDAAPEAAQAEAPPMPQRKPEAIAELTLGFRVLAYEVTDEADVLGLRWLRDPPDIAPEAPKVLDKDDSVVRRCFAELLHHHESNAG